VQAQPHCDTGITGIAPNSGVIFTAKRRFDATALHSKRHPEGVNGDVAAARQIETRHFIAAVHALKLLQAEARALHVSLERRGSFRRRDAVLGIDAQCDSGVLIQRDLLD
jgi:hypothetical protein